MAPKISIKRLNLAVQGNILKKHFPESIVRIKHGQLVWEGALIPTPLSNSYRVRILYKLKKKPCIEVVEPQLKKRNGVRCEHMYADNRPCLYWPRAAEWDGSMLLVDTIVPWLSEWLTHYEIWLATGQWHGRGVHIRNQNP